MWELTKTYWKQCITHVRLHMLVIQRHYLHNILQACNLQLQKKVRKIEKVSQVKHELDMNKSKCVLMVRETQKVAVIKF